MSQTQGYQKPNYLTQTQIDELGKQREEMLEQIRSKLSRKVFYGAEERLLKQQTELKNILDWQEGKNSELSKFSLVLDPHYFEQEFMSFTNY